MASNPQMAACGGGIGPLQPFFFQQLQALVEQEEREKAKGHTVIL